MKCQRRVVDSFLFFCMIGRMPEMPETPAPEETSRTAISAWGLAGRVCAGVVVASVLACVIMAAVRSTGLTEVTVTALDPDAEPRDHKLPFVKQKEALPDYQITINLDSGDQIQLGAKPDTSAADGLT